MKLRLSIYAIVVSLLLIFVPWLRAQDGLLGALAQQGTRSQLAFDFTQPLAAADFDNDNKPDAAVLLPAGLTDGKQSFRIELHVTSGRDDTIVFSAVERSLSISALDVNRDGAPDIVIEKPFTRQRVQVYLNDGHGVFHEARSEDFAFPEPLSDTLRAWFVELTPSSYLPSTRGFEIASLTSLPLFASGGRQLFRCRPDDLSLRAGPRTPSHSRAPPVSHSL